MMLNIKRLFWLFLAVGTLKASGQEKLTLQQVLQKIEENHPGLKAFESRILSKDARAEGASAWMAPMAGAGTFMTPYPGAEVMDAKDKGAWMFSAEQEIPNPVKLRAKTEFLKAQSAIDLAAKGVSANELKAAGKQLYYDLLVAYRRLRYQKENLQIMNTMKKLAEIRYPYNQAGLNNVFKAEGRSYEAQNMILMTESEIKSKKFALNALMNRPYHVSYDIDTAMDVTFIPVAQLDTAYLATARSDIRQMDQSIEAMRLNINQMRQEAKPDFRVRFEHMSSRSAMMPKQYTLMGMISIPIAPWSSKMYTSEVKSMGFELQGMQQDRAAMLIQMTGMARSMETELQAMEKQLENYEKRILPALTKNLKVTMLSYQENKTDLAGVIDSWETINMAQMNYLNQLQAFYKMIADYERNIQR
jgi:outer membrane protein, heavy metal efflux system